MAAGCLANAMEDINFAIKVLRRSHNALTTANMSIENSKYGQEGISSVKRLLEFNVHDIDNILHLIRVSMDSVGQ